MKKRRERFWKGLVLGLAMTLMAGSPVQAAASAKTAETGKVGKTAQSYKNQIVTKKGKKYYYDSKGNLVTCKYGYKIKNKYYKVSKKGVLTQISEAQGLAGIKMNRYYNKSKSYALWKAFQWSANLTFYTNSNTAPKGQKAVEYFALIGFKRNRGNCVVQAAAFCMMARALGYDAKLVQGYVPQALDSAGNPTDFGSHAWVTIEQDGKTYVYDPNFSAYCKTNNIQKGLKSGYKITYGASGTYRYFNKKKVEIK